MLEYFLPEELADCDQDCETVELEFNSVEAVTDKAALIETLDGDELWIPRSQIVAADERSVRVTTWWAEKEGFV